MTVSFDQLKTELERVLLQLSFPKSKAGVCAAIFAGNSRDGVYSHGLNRFPVFVNLVKEGLVDPNAEPERLTSTGTLEHWDGHRGPIESLTDVHMATIALAAGGRVVLPAFRAYPGLCPTSLKARPGAGNAQFWSRSGKSRGGREQGLGLFRQVAAM